MCRTLSRLHLKHIVLKYAKPPSGPSVSVRMSLNPDLGHLYHDSDISSEFIAIDAKEHLRTREINAREQRHLDYQNHALTRARDICERTRNWERWNIERQMKSIKEKTPSLEHSLRQEANKLKRYEKMMQEVYGARAPVGRHVTDKFSQSHTGSSGKKSVDRVPFSNVSFGKFGRHTGVSGVASGGVYSDSAHSISTRTSGGHLPIPLSKPGETPEDGSVSYGYSSFTKAGKDGTDYLSRNSVFVDGGSRQTEDGHDDEDARYGRQRYDPAATLARPRNLRRRNEHVVRSLLRLYHRADDRKREMARAHSEGGMTTEAVLERALVVLRGTAEERTVARLLSQLRFGAPSPRRHLSDSFLEGPRTPSPDPLAALARRRNTEGIHDQLRMRDFGWNASDALLESRRKPSGGSSGGGRGDVDVRHREWGPPSVNSQTSDEFPADDACFVHLEDASDAGAAVETLTDDSVSRDHDTTSTAERKGRQLRKADRGSDGSEAEATFLTKLPPIKGLHR